MPMQAQDDFFNQMQESEPRRFGLLDYLKLLCLAAALIGIYLFVKRGGVHGIVHYLINAFFTIGVVYLGIGVFSWSNHEGLFDGGGYGIRSVIDITKSAVNSRHEKKYRSFMDYKKSKAKKRLGVRYHFTVTGGIFILFSIALMFVD